MCTQTTLDIITNKVVLAAKESLGMSLDKVILYGSYARGDYSDESDIDILILADIPKEDTSKEVRRIWEHTGDLDLEYNVLVSVYIIDCATFYKYTDDLPFYSNVLNEGVLLNA